TLTLHQRFHDEHDAVRPVVDGGRMHEPSGCIASPVRARKRWLFVVGEAGLDDPRLVPDVLERREVLLVGLAREKAFLDVPLDDALVDQTLVLGFLGHDISSDGRENYGPRPRTSSPGPAESIAITPATAVRCPGPFMDSLF